MHIYLIHKVQLQLSPKGGWQGNEAALLLLLHLHGIIILVPRVASFRFKLEQQHPAAGAVVLLDLVFSFVYFNAKGLLDFWNLLCTSFRFVRFVSFRFVSFHSQNMVCSVPGIRLFRPTIVASRQLLRDCSE